MKLIKLTGFILKVIVGDLKILSMILVFPLIGLFFPMVFFPLAEGGMPLSVQITTIIPTAILFGTATYSFKNSTMYSNFRSTNPNKSNLYLATMLSTTLIMFLLILEYIFFLYIFTETDLINPNWLWFDNASHFDYSFEDFDYFVFAISTLEICALTFAISFTLRNIIKNLRTYYILWICVLVICLMWGATLNSFFGVEKHGITFQRNLVPKSMFVTSILFPFYAPSQLVALVAIKFQNGRDILFNAQFANQASETAYYIVLISPPIWLAIFTTLGLILRKET